MKCTSVYIGSQTRALRLSEVDRLQRVGWLGSRFVIDRDPYIPIYDLTLTETFALVMAVRQLSATGDFVLTYDALNAVRESL